ncbi:MAG: hypothetical protein KKD99_04950, partial [Proteobacteria bacterium]|nr:hypothetical protein [Pseudomonadota bacterium]
MTPASRGKAWWGLGLVLVLVILGGLYFSGLVPLPFAQPKPKALCYVSPKNPNFIKETPGKDPEGNELVPVYATPTGAQKPTGSAVAVAPKAERKIKYWVAPMDP